MQHAETRRGPPQLAVPPRSPDRRVWAADAESHLMDASTYRWPAEWEPHAATWLTWPYNEDDWPDRYGPIPWVFGEIVQNLSRVERVRLLVNEANEADARRLLKRIEVNDGNVFLRQVV